MKIKIAAILSLTIWISGGLYFYTSFVKKNRAAQHQIATPIKQSAIEKKTNEAGIDSTKVVKTIDSLSNSTTTNQYTLEPRTINTGFNLTDFTPDEDFRTYAKKIQAHLTNNPNKKLHILGHTDSTGDDEVNIWVSQQRANTLKKYFIDLGIDENQIIAIAKGETEPLDTNSSIEGRRKNRRIELIIK